MQQTKSCPKCNGSMKRSDDLTALVAVFRESKGYNVRTNMFIPARTYICSQCGFIEFYNESS